MIYTIRKLTELLGVGRTTINYHMQKGHLVPSRQYVSGEIVPYDESRKGPGVSPLFSEENVEAMIPWVSRRVREKWETRDGHQEAKS